MEEKNTFLHVTDSAVANVKPRSHSVDLTLENASGDPLPGTQANGRTKMRCPGRAVSQQPVIVLQKSLIAAEHSSELKEEEAERKQMHAEQKEALKERCQEL